MIEQKFVQRIAAEVGTTEERAAAAIPLFDKGATVPFVARYRKDITGNLTEAQLEHIEKRNAHFVALTNRRNAVLENIARQGKLSEDLRMKIENCDDPILLEDLYLPFKKQRRTKAGIARDQGLEPLANFIWTQQLAQYSIAEYAETFVNAAHGILSPEAALLGAYDILAEQVASDAEARALIRDNMLRQGKIVTAATKNAQDQKTKFESYYAFSEGVASIPSHRLLAALRGVRMGVLRMDIVIDDAQVMADVAAQYIKQPGSCFEPHIRTVIEEAYKRLLRPAIENEVINIARNKADEEAIGVFRENARHMLMAAPAGRIPVMGVNAGLNAAFALGVVNEAGAYLENRTILRGDTPEAAEEAANTIFELLQKHHVRGIAIGSGPGARDAARLVDSALKKLGRGHAFMVFVNQAGAAVYAASKLARQELPELDTPTREAISIARRLQDPLAELVKLEPRAIGVGQYQHDVNQRRLREGLSKTMVSCVSRVGADLNTVSVELLRYISGLQMGTAQNVVEHRAKNGGFTTRAQLLEVSGIGEKTFEQCAGFLRISSGAEPLDATAIHPEAYPVVAKIAAQLNVEVAALASDPEKLRALDLAPFATETIGPLTLADIREELLKPGHDPRREFRVPKFIEGVYDVSDLEEGMDAEGVVTNVTDFGAFVDIGVQQDGLVHLSELANRFVRDPGEVVKVGDIIRVKVVKVDKVQRRISLSRKALLTQPRRRPRPAPGEKAETDTRQPAERARRGAAPREGAERDGGRAPDERRRPRERRAPDDARRGKASQETPAARRARSVDRDGAPRGGDRHRERPDRRPSSRPQFLKGADEPLMNTQLADQLAALRDKFKS